MPNRNTAKDLGIADLEPALDAIAAALREHHPPELYVWAVPTWPTSWGRGT